MEAVLVKGNGVVRRISSCLLLCVFAAQVCAQQSGQANVQQGNQPATPTTFRSRSQLVLVPTTVEKSGKAVLGLNKENFVIEEDGHDRPIGVFEAITTNNLRVDRPKRGNEFDNFNSDQTPRSMMLIAIDAINTPFGYQEAVRKDVLKYLSKNISPNQLTGMVVMSTKGIRLVHDFTGSTSSLVTALQNISGENNRYNGLQDIGHAPTVDNTSISSKMDQRGEPTPDNRGGTGSQPGLSEGKASTDTNREISIIQKQLTEYLKGQDKVEEYQLKNRIRRTLESFQQIAQGLAGYPGRKSLIWASAGFPAPLDPTRFNDMELMGIYERTLKVLADANVAVYPVDVKGLQTVSPGADATLDQYDRLANKDPGTAYKEATLKVNTFNEFAERTGGRAWFDINNNDKAIKAAVEDSQSYYMLGYYIDSSSTKDGWHKLKVKLKSADGKVRTRSGYFFTAAALDPELNRKNDLSVGVRSPFDYTTLRLRGEILGVTGEGSKKKVAFRLDVPATDNILTDGNAINLDFVAVARKTDTEIAGQSMRNIAMVLKPEAVAEIQKDGMSYKNFLELEPGTYEIRFLVRDNKSGRMGSALTSVSVK